MITEQVAQEAIGLEIERHCGPDALNRDVILSKDIVVIVKSWIVEEDVHQCVTAEVASVVRQRVQNSQCLSTIFPCVSSLPFNDLLE